jgi:hypothetical protein
MKDSTKANLFISSYDYQAYTSNGFNEYIKDYRVDNKDKSIYVFSSTEEAIKRKEMFNKKYLESRKINGIYKLNK